MINFYVLFLRLRVPHQNHVNKQLFSELNNASIIRELQVFGKQAQINNAPQETMQHRSLGMKLMLEAENLSKSLGFNKIAVISGIGVRPYYKKLGYEDRRLLYDKNIAVINFSGIETAGICNIN